MVLFDSTETASSYIPSWSVIGSAFQILRASDYLWVKRALLRSFGWLDYLSWEHVADGFHFFVQFYEEGWGSQKV